jgi:membrane associated rhomboid family serine protease
MIDNQPLRRVPTGDVGAVGGNEVSCETARPSYHKIPALSVLSAMFLHGGWLHLLGNMLFLWIFGNNVEDRFGRIRYLLFYLLCGYVAAYGFALADPDSTTPLIGASGAIAGVLGAYIVLFPRARVWSLVPVLFFIPLRLPAWLVLGLWFVLQWFYSAGHAVSAGSPTSPTWSASSPACCSPWSSVPRRAAPSTLGAAVPRRRPIPAAGADIWPACRHDTKVANRILSPFLGHIRIGRDGNKILILFSPGRSSAALFCRCRLLTSAV